MKVLARAPGARAEIVGTQLVGIHDTVTHLIEVHAVSVGDQVLHLELLRSIKVPKGDFLVAKVVRPGDDEMPLWSFKVEGYAGLGKIYYDRQTGEYIILLVNPRPDPRQPILERIIPLSDLLKATRCEIGETRDVVYVGGGYTPAQLIAVKERIARDLRVEYTLSRLEQNIRKGMRARQAEQEALEKAAKEAEAQARREAQEARRAEIMARPTITVWTVDGQKRWGIPVVGEEWMMLRNNLGVVRVEEYPADLMHPIEAFFVEKAKGSGRCEKRGVVLVTLDRPVQQIPNTQPDPKFFGMFFGRKFDKEAQGLVGEETLVFQADKTNFDLLKSRGQNGGMLVTLDEQPNDRGRYQVHVFEESGVRSDGEYELTATLS